MRTTDVNSKTVLEFWKEFTKNKSYRFIENMSMMEGSLINLKTTPRMEG